MGRIKLIPLRGLASGRWLVDSGDSRPRWACRASRG